uniref:YopX family protein n=1 Tax=Fulvivirga sp. TaxID=1931237 RepID=UPI00404A7489
MDRKFKFKAWNKETQLMMRLNQIDCEKGVLFKKDHILLQFTGHYDKSKTEVYEADILLFGTEKRMIVWDELRYGWAMIGEEGKKSSVFSKYELEKGVKLCSYYESPTTFKK